MAMSAPVKTLERRPLTHGPSNASSLHSSNKNTVALGSSTPASLHCVRQQAERRPGRQHQYRRRHDKAAIDGIECLRLGRLTVQRMAQREHLADRISSRQRNGHRANHAGVDQRDCEEDARQMSGMSANARRDSRNIWKPTASACPAKVAAVSP
jgi:hypothetical protein